MYFVVHFEAVYDISISTKITAYVALNICTPSNSKAVFTLDLSIQHFFRCCNGRDMTSHSAMSL